MMDRYNHALIENKWREIWLREKLDQTDIAGTGKSFYNLMMFPYPSAEGLHVGNMYAFTGSDIYGRFKRMQGFDVFEPIGLDGFGIHSENYSLKIGRHPMDHAKITESNFYGQLHKIGAMFDWSRTVETYDPDYYRWTQWIFVQMFKHGLAYRDKASVNWCPSDKTVLADEQVIDGKCERCGNIVEKRLLDQWFFRITAYAEKLLENLSNLDWSEKVKVSQKNWIGKKEGIIINYPILQLSNTPMQENKMQRSIDVFTTRPDTNFGATFVAIAPEHPLAGELANNSPLVPEKKQHEIAAYVKKHAGLSEVDRIAEGRKKTGVFTGLYCVNSLNKYKMPLYISDFVVMGVGTGAVVGVPGHDKRDFELAQTFTIPVVRVVVGPDGDTSAITEELQVQEEEGTMVNSDFLNGLSIPAATKKMMDYLEEKGWGKRVATYHLRDWLISRQRYWGPPIPMIFCEKCNKEKKGEREEMPGWYSVPQCDLPVLLPRIDDYKPGDDGVAPLAKHKEFYETKCPGCGGKAVRETDVSDTFLDSSWYFLRYPSIGVAEVASSVIPAQAGIHQPLSSQQPWIPDQVGDDKHKPWDPSITKKWLPVAMYTGGAEHSVLHLMYARFVTMALHDFGYLDFEEPFPKFYAHGLVIKDGAKMSKSKGNVVNPDEYINLYGADSLRLYLMFMGPFDQGGDFRDTAMEGLFRWVNRVWRMATGSIEVSHPRGGGIVPSLRDQGHLGGESRALHKLVKKVTEDIEKRRYNTAIAAMMEFTNLVEDQPQGRTLSVEDLKTFLLLLAPFAPYVTEELWQRMQKLARGSLKFGKEVRNLNLDQQTSNVQFHDLTSNFQSPTSSFHSIHLQPWPVYNPAEIVEDKVIILVQVNGRLRDKLTVDRQQSKDQSAIEESAKNRERVKKFLEGKRVVKSVFVPGKLINFVV